MKKIFIALVAPLLSVVMLFGCTAPSYSVNDVNKKHTELMDAYIEEGSNQIFKFNLFGADSELDEGANFDEGNLSFTLEKLMYIAYIDEMEVQINKSLTSAVEESDAQYKQLLTVYQNILSLIYNYYANWSYSFYSNIEETEITKKEINSLYVRLNDLNKAVANFVEAKLNVERVVRKSGTKGIAATQIDGLNYKLNGVVDASLGFVNRFKELHKKYLVLEVDSDFSENYALRLVDEVLLQIAEAVYYENVKSFETSNTVKIYELLTTFKDSPYNIVSNNVWLNDLFSYSELAKVKLPNSNLNATILETETTIKTALTSETSEIKDRANNLILQLQTYSKGFAQDFKLYKSVYKKVNLETYNIYRGLANKTVHYDVNNLNSKEISNMSILKDFNTSNISLIVNILLKIASNA